MRGILIFLWTFLFTGIFTYGQCAGAVGCPTLQMSGTSVSCYGNANGTAAVAEQSGIGPSFLQYKWSTGELTNSISGKIAGTYSVTVKNTCTGCTASGVYTVNTPDPIVVSSFNGNVNCFNGNNGSIQLAVNGGVAPYTYLWTHNNNVTTANLNNLTAGTYSVTVKDNKNCTKSYSTTITQPTSSLGLSYTKVNVSCFGTGTGSIDNSPFGGTPPYAYSWSGVAANTQDVSGLTAQTYIVTITDNKACALVQPIVITQPTVLTAQTGSTGVSCFGFSDGIVGVTTSGGTSPYNYSWSNSTFVYSQNIPQLSNVPSDVYTAHITDAKGCNITKTKTVTTPSAISITNAAITHILCFGESTGKIKLSVLGGTVTGNYNFIWSNSVGVILGQNSDSLTNFPAGNYVVEISDDNDCILTQNYTITQPQAPMGILLNSLTHVLCYGNNTGAIDITPTGGTPGYTYSWETSANVNIGFTQDKINLVTDVYNVLVTDANGCSVSGTYTVNQPNQPLIATYSITPVVCFGESNGMVNITTIGGTSPYGYEWTNSTYQLSLQNEDLINYPSDTYSLIITDNHGCLFTSNYFIPEPAVLTGSLLGINILCKNQNTGSIDLSVQGGVLPYQYSWSNGPSSQDQVDLYTGNYIVTVTDDNFCPFVDSIFLSEPVDTLSYNYSQEDVKCNAEANGSINFIPSGGTPAYSILWSNTDIAFQINNLTAGFYSYTFKDTNNCSILDSIEIIQPDVLLANEVITWVTCHSFSDGDIDINPSGGNLPYNYTWYNSQFALSSQNQDLLAFPSDVYHLELRDSLNCLTELYIPLPQPDPLNITYSKADVTCAGGSDATIDIEVTGGNPAYTFTWSNLATSEDLTDIPFGEYQVLVNDTKNCTDSLTIAINEPNPITIDFETTSVSCEDQKDGTILAMPKGGTGTFSYLWSNLKETPFVDNLLGGDYTVTATDIVGCTGTSTTFLSTEPISCIIPPNAFTPNKDAYNDTWFLKNISIYPEMNIQIFNKWGKQVFEASNTYEEWDGVFHGVPLPSETYYYIIVLNQQIDPVKGTVTIIR
jgi:gliding motility-associated-like protein